MATSLIRPLRLGFELTFLPRRPRSRWQEWRSYEEACETTNHFNSALWDSDDMDDWAAKEGCLPRDLLWGKADIFRSKLLSTEPQPHNSWCLEVNNEPIDSGTLLSEFSYASDALKTAFRIARNLDLHPCVTRRKRDGTMVEYPTGGGHIHVGTAFWAEGAEYHLRMAVLEQRLCLDFANEPWLRWLFAQWSEDANHADALSMAEVKELRRIGKKAQATPSSIARAVHNYALQCQSIKQRSAVTGKPTRPTLEFRFFDAPRSMEELTLQVRFITAWFRYHIEKVNLAFEEGDPAIAVTPYTLTPKRYARLGKDIAYGRAEMERFLGGGGLGMSHLSVTSILEAFYERNYVNRVRFGKIPA